MTATASPTGPSAARAELPDELESHRRELTGYCYRMLGSGSEAEDAVQETMVRAWRAIDGFEGRSALRSWLYKIATNVCLDMARAPQRRARPMDLGPASPADSSLGSGLPEHHWVQPVQTAKVVPTDGDPAVLAETRETIRLAFVAALQHLPARQRAVLILRDVLRWQAAEVAELLDSTVASVNSALQRAHATLETVQVEDRPLAPQDERTRVLLQQYVAAFESYDVDLLVTLLRDDVAFSMPPFELWVTGPDEVGRFLSGTGAACRGSRLLATSANGTAAFGSYKPAGPDAAPGVTHEPWSIQVIEVTDDRISGFHSFLYPELFPAFGLPERLTEADAALDDPA